MPRERTDAALLFDMASAAEAVVRFLAGKTRESYGCDEILRAAVERKIEVIGEAARGISRALRVHQPHIPWDKIAGTRHVLAHDYDQVDDDIVWRIATIYVPELLGQITPLLPPAPDILEPEPPSGHRDR